MKHIKLILLSLFTVSAAILCFEIIATRISSVIFVNNYAFMILSLSILGLGTGGIYSYYAFGKTDNKEESVNVLYTKIISALSSLSISLLLFILAVVIFPGIEKPLFFFLLLFFPFFFAGIFYALIFRLFASESFKIYASDLSGAAGGALLALAALTSSGPVPSVLLIIVFLSVITILLKSTLLDKTKKISSWFLPVSAAFLFIFQISTGLLGTIPIGNFPEKDFHHVYPDQNVTSTIVDSRWSIFGRSDLVTHSHQDIIRHMFIDGAAGTQMIRFNGNPNHPDPTVQQQLLQYTSTLPLLVLEEDERNNMLNIGPGGGREVLAGLIFGVEHITGVEINPDFVHMVKDYHEFNGGLYTDFPNVEILIREGRQYARQKHDEYDLLVMVMPSTQQVQSIDNYALSENYLITVEAIQDYLEVLTNEGRMIFTVYNEIELQRLITTVTKAFESVGIPEHRVPFHLVVIEDQYSPTLVIKKQAFNPGEIQNHLEFMQQIPPDFPTFTYLPYQWDNLTNSNVNRLLLNLYDREMTIDDIVAEHAFDISPTYDDSPYFYKIEKGIPYNFSWLLYAVFGFNVLIIGIPYMMIPKIAGKKKKKQSFTRNHVQKPLLLFTSLGLGFMIVEIALFQKLVLYLGTPTVSLSVLLSSLLVGMGIGSYSGNRFFADNHYKRLMFFTALIVLFGIAVILLYPLLLHQLLIYGIVTRAVITFFLLIPFGFMLGIPFPTCLRMMEDEGLDKIIPWMYGINGTMSVLGSILAVVFSMLMGFTPAYFLGLICYFFIFVYCAFLIKSQTKPAIAD